MTEDEVAFYDALETNDSAVKALGDQNLRFIAQDLVKNIRESVTIDWTERQSVRAKLRVMVKRILRKYGNTVTHPTSKRRRYTPSYNRQNYYVLIGLGEAKSQALARPAWSKPPLKVNGVRLHAASKITENDYSGLA